MNPIATAHYGMFAAAQQLAAAASQAVQPDADYAKAAAEMIAAQDLHRANAEVVRTADEMLGALVNVRT
ncbi:MAG: flagellar hook protein FlgE [Phenylobacterium sp.]